MHMVIYGSNMNHVTLLWLEVSLTFWYYLIYFCFDIKFSVCLALVVLIGTTSNKAVEITESYEFFFRLSPTQNGSLSTKKLHLVSNGI